MPLMHMHCKRVVMVDQQYWKIYVNKYKTGKTYEYAVDVIRLVHGKL